MKSWKVKVFDEGDSLLEEKIIKSNSRFYVKKLCKRFVENTNGAESYSYGEVNENHI